MQRLSAASLLDAWERGRRAPPFRRALLLLEAAEGRSPSLAALPLGERDARLTVLREAVFGSRLECVTSCPQCRELLEFSLAAADLPLGERGPEAAITVASGDFEVEFRLPTTADLDEVADVPAERRRAALLHRCMLAVRRAGEPAAAAELPEAAITAVLERARAAHPQASFAVGLACPACGHAWQSPLDVVAYFWAEVDAWARRTLREVHALASAYGWSEAQILGLSARRRRSYLELVGP